MRLFGVTPQERAAWILRRAIRKAAEDVEGAKVVEAPIDGMTAVTRRVLDNPLAGLRAAALARNVAMKKLRDYAEQARGAGWTWDELAEVWASMRKRDRTHAVSRPTCC
jgi:hypothetical protein